MPLLSRLCHTDLGRDDPRRPVWLEATDSFYKKLNRIARECKLSRYEALSRGLDALLREDQVRNSALNRNIKSPAQSEVFRRTMGQVSRNYWATISPEEKRDAREEKRSGTLDSRSESGPTLIEQLWTDRSRTRRTLRGGRPHPRLPAHIIRSEITIQNLDGISFELDRELWDDLLEGFLLFGNRDRAIFG